MKSKRQAKILEIISNTSIGTQEELMQSLTDQGFCVTQATISRDIREMGIVKVQTSTGEYRYAATAKERDAKIPIRFTAIFAEAVSAVDSAKNIVVVKCHTGMANAVCAALDSMQMDNAVGTISGDDTFIIIMRDDEGAQNMVSRLKLLIR